MDLIENAPPQSFLEQCLLRTKRSGLFIVGIILLFCLGGYAGYQTLFSTFASYDDEGYVMISLQSVVNGNALYDETYSQYGPAFFQLKSAIHWVTGQSISHDVVRFQTLAVWLTISFFGGLILYRINGHKMLAVIAGLLTYLHLDRLVLEPGHPQELCLLGIFVAIYSATFLRKEESRFNQYNAAIGIGATLAIVTLIKLNVGLLLVIPIATAAVWLLEDKRLRRFLLPIFVVGSLAIPSLILIKHGTISAERQLPLAVMGGLIATFVVARNRYYFASQESEAYRIDLKTFILCIASMAVIATCVVCLALLGGTSPSGLIEGMFLQHTRFANVFHTPARVSGIATIVAVAAVWVAFRSTKNRMFPILLVRIMFVICIVAVAMIYLLESRSELVNGMIDRGFSGFLIAVAAPFAWVILIRSEGSASSCDSFLRLAICLTAIMQPLVAYPIPGTQTAVGTVLLLIVAVVVLGDLMQALSESSQSVSIADESESFDSLVDVPQQSILGPLTILTVLVLCLVSRAEFHSSRRASMIALDLPGAKLLKLPESEASWMQDLVIKLKSECDTFVFAENARNSFYFWAEKKPPTALNATVWPYMLNHRQQLKSRELIRGGGNVVLLRDNYGGSTDWLPDDSPLLRYFDCNYLSDESVGKFTVWKKLLDD